MDDRRFFDCWGCPLEKIKEFVLTINPNYDFRFEDEYQPDDILVAYIP